MGHFRAESVSETKRVKNGFFSQHHLFSCRYSDASWEDNDAYADQLVLPTDCTARNCANANGRKGSMETLLYCIMCGSNPVHTECTSIKNQDFCCEDCSVVLNRPLEVFESHDVDDDEDNDANDSDDDDNDNEDKDNADDDNDDANNNNNNADDDDDDDLDPLEKFLSMANSATLSSATIRSHSRPTKPETKSDSESDFDWDISKFTQFKNEKDNVNSAAAAPTVMQPNNEQLRTRNIQQRGMGNRRTLAAETVSTRLRTRSRSSHTRSRSPVGELVERRSSRNYRQSPDRAQMDTSPLIWRGRQRLRSRNTEVSSPFDISCVANRTRARSRR